jgi:hypothetical protein
MAIASIRGNSESAKLIVTPVEKNREICHAEVAGRGLSRGHAFSVILRGTRAFNARCH